MTSEMKIMNIVKKQMWFLKYMYVQRTTEHQDVSLSNIMESDVAVLLQLTNVEVVLHGLFWWAFVYVMLPDLASAVLMSSLVNLHKAVQHNPTGRATVALFKVLFTFYRQHLNSCLPGDIKQWVTYSAM